MADTGSTTTDARALTLPDWRTGLKRRLRRPKRPNPLRVMFGYVVGLNALMAVFDLIRHAYIDAAISMTAAAVMWKLLHARMGDMSAYYRCALALFALVLVALLNVLLMTA